MAVTSVIIKLQTKDTLRSTNSLYMKVSGLAVTSVIIA